MKKEKSCGAIVFTSDKNVINYVIIESKEGYFGFPKGRVENTETEEETAIREIYEETSLHVNLINGFRTEDFHTFSRNNETKMKHVVYFVAEYYNQIPIAQETELNSIHLVSFKEAITMLQFESSKKFLTEANEFIINHCKYF